MAPFQVSCNVFVMNQPLVYLRKVVAPWLSAGKNYGIENTMRNFAQQLINV